MDLEMFGTFLQQSMNSFLILVMPLGAVCLVDSSMFTFQDH